MPQFFRIYEYKCSYSLVYIDARTQPNIYAHGGTFEVKKGEDYRMFLQNYTYAAECKACPQQTHAVTRTCPCTPENSNRDREHKPTGPSCMALHARE
jgi:hypothetical protein